MIKTILKIIAKVICGIIGSVVGLFLLAWIGLAIGKNFIYSDYYKVQSKEAKNAGLNQGFVPQGCTYNEDDDYFVTAGYMANESVSRIYKIDNNSKKETYYTLKSNGEDFYGHTGGIQYAKGYFYLANEGDGIYKFPASSLSDNPSVEIGAAIKVNNHSSFVFAEGDYLYVGEFNDDNKYACSNDFSYNGKTHKAIVTKYNLNNLNKPVQIYSIGNQIQGFAITPKGKIVLSRSYGMVDSNFYVFEPKDVIDTNMKLDGAKVYFLDRDNCSKNLKAPAMSEDMDVKGDKVIYLSESACNKYILGKFFGDFHIYGLKLD